MLHQTLVKKKKYITINHKQSVKCSLSLYMEINNFYSTLYIMHFCAYHVLC